MIVIAILSVINIVVIYFYTLWMTENNFKVDDMLSSNFVVTKCELIEMKTSKIAVDYNKYVYVPAIKYSYIFDGKQYINTTFSSPEIRYTDYGIVTTKYNSLIENPYVLVNKYTPEVSFFEIDDNKILESYISDVYSALVVFILIAINYYFVGYL